MPDGSKGNMGEITGSVGAGFYGGVRSPGGLTPVGAGSITGLPKCPTTTRPKVDGKITVEASYGVGRAFCTYSINSGSWNCSGEISYGQGVSIGGDGSIEISGQYFLK